MSDQPSTRTAAERLLIELREWDPDQPETMIRELTAEIQAEAIAADRALLAEQVRALSDAATPGPWNAVSVSIENDRWTITRVGHNLEPLMTGGRMKHEADAAFIAAAVNEIRRQLEDRPND